MRVKRSSTNPGSGPRQFRLFTRLPPQALTIFNAGEAKVVLPFV
jgi:hypothetical protein